MEKSESKMEQLKVYADNVVARLNSRYPGTITEGDISSFLTGVLNSPADEIEKKVDALANYVATNYTKNNFGKSLDDKRELNVSEPLETGSSELDSMLLGGDTLKKATGGNNNQKSGGKVFVKTNGQSISSSSDEGGYTSVVGVIFVIVAVCFILSALFINLLS